MSQLASLTPLKIWALHNLLDRPDVFTWLKCDGRMVILLMEEILHQLIGRLSHHLQGFIHCRWCRISSSNSSLIGFTLLLLRGWNDWNVRLWIEVKEKHWKVRNPSLPLSYIIKILYGKKYLDTLAFPLWIESGWCLPSIYCWCTLTPLPFGKLLSLAGGRIFLKVPRHTSKKTRDTRHAPQAARITPYCKKYHVYNIYIYIVSINSIKLIFYIYIYQIYNL